MAGYMMGHQMGLGLARVYNPEFGEETDIVGQLLMFIGIAIFIAIGGLEALFLALLTTFERIPLGAFGMDHLPMEIVVGILGSAFELVLRVAAPVLCIIMLLMVAMGFVMKTMPQINILSVGFPLKILLGLLMLILGLVAIQQAATDEIADALSIILHWTRNL
jgi:flagellar biosynthesis protein FliR